MEDGILVSVATFFEIIEVRSVFIEDEVCINTFCSKQQAEVVEYGPFLGIVIDFSVLFIITYLYSECDVANISGIFLDMHENAVGVLERTVEVTTCIVHVLFVDVQLFLLCL